MIILDFNWICIRSTSDLHRICIRFATEMYQFWLRLYLWFEEKSYLASTCYNRRGAWIWEKIRPWLLSQHLNKLFWSCRITTYEMWRRYNYVKECSFSILPINVILNVTIGKKIRLYGPYIWWTPRKSADWFRGSSSNIIWSAAQFSLCRCADQKLEDLMSAQAIGLRQWDSCLVAFQDNKTTQTGCYRITNKRTI